MDWLERKPFTTLFVPGNHENWNRLTGIRDERLLGSWLFSGMPEAEKERLRAGCPRAAWRGGHVRVVRPSVLMLEPGVFSLCGRKVFAYGGAASHDIGGGVLHPADYKDMRSLKAALMAVERRALRPQDGARTQGLTWWAQEIPDAAEEAKAVAALEANGWSADFVLPHDCAASSRVLLGYGDGLSRVNRFLEEAKQRLSYGHWFFGRLHGNRTLPGGRERLLYEQIVQIS